MQAQAATVQQLLLLALLLAAGSTQLAAADLTEEQLEARKEERLQWLLVTKPNAKNVQLNCTSRFDYPFSLLENDTNSIGAEIRRMWWVLPDRSLAPPGYNDNNRRVSADGSTLTVSVVTEAVHGLYHCAAEAQTQENSTIVRVYYYKKGLNLYGADVYNSLWDKYSMNVLTGSLTSGTFLALVGAWILLNRSGLIGRFRGSKVAADDQSEAAAAAAGAKAEEKRSKAQQEMEMSVARRPEASRESISSGAASSSSASAAAAAV